MHTIWLWASLACLVAVAGARAEGPPEMPMRIRPQDAAAPRWLAKKVLRARLLDDMESLKAWKISTWSQGKGEGSLTDERAVDGKHSVRFRSRTKGANSLTGLLPP